MKILLLVTGLLLVGQQSDKNPDLDLKSREDLDPDTDVAILRNLSSSKVYTVTVRRREFRKRYRVYNIEHKILDTVIVKRDTLVRYAAVVVPPKKWRYLSVTFEGESVETFDKHVSTDTGHVSTYKFKIMSSKLGGDVKQVYSKPEPFATKQPSTSMYYFVKGTSFSNDKSFYDTYIGSIH